MEKSRGILTGEDIGPKVLPHDATLRRPLECRPPNSIEQRSTLQPIRDGLLTDRGPSLRRRVVDEVLPQLGRQCSLPPSDLDGSAQCGDVVAVGDRVARGDNVVVLHGPETYTRKLVAVNNDACFTPNKDSCNVLNMPTTKRKPTPQQPKADKRKRPPEQDIGPDGRTLAQRTIALMAERNVGQTELARMCSTFYSTFVPTAEDKVKQQHIFNIVQGQASSWALPLIAAVFDVNDLWLQFGIGAKERRGASH